MRVVSVLWVLSRSPWVLQRIPRAQEDGDWRQYVTRSAEREALAGWPATLELYCHTGPLSVMLIGWLSTRKFFITPLMVTEPPAELIPLLSDAM